MLARQIIYRVAPRNAVMVPRARVELTFRQAETPADKPDNGLHVRAAFRAGILRQHIHRQSRTDAAVEQTGLERQVVEAGLQLAYVPTQARGQKITDIVGQDDLKLFCLAHEDAPAHVSGRTFHAGEDA